MDPSQDPDRYDPAQDVAPAGPLDPTLDPDRFDQTLPQLLGREEERESAEWLLGLLFVLGFLALVSIALTVL